MPWFLARSSLNLLCALNRVLNFIPYSVIPYSALYSLPIYSVCWLTNLRISSQVLMLGNDLGTTTAGTNGSCPASIMENTPTHTCR